MKIEPFTGIESLKDFDAVHAVLEFAAGFDDEDSFVQETHMLVDQVITDVTVSDLMLWYSSAPEANLEYMTRYIKEYWDEARPQDAGLDVVYGGLYVFVEDTLVAVYDDLKEQEMLPWQKPECFYCEAKDVNIQKDRIGQYACKTCWVESMDGPW